MALFWFLSLLLTHYCMTYLHSTCFLVGMISCLEMTQSIWKDVMGHIQVLHHVYVMDGSIHRPCPLGYGGHCTNTHKHTRTHAHTCVKQLIEIYINKNWLFLGSVITGNIRFYFFHFISFAFLQARIDFTISTKSDVNIKRRRRDSPHSWGAHRVPSFHM